MSGWKLWELKYRLSSSFTEEIWLSYWHSSGEPDREWIQEWWDQGHRGWYSVSDFEIREVLPGDGTEVRDRIVEVIR